MTKYPLHPCEVCGKQSTYIVVTDYFGRKKRIYGRFCQFHLIAEK